MLVLGIESSCDETAAAVVADGTVMKSNIIASQVDIHSKYGGVVPEIASRKHIEAITPVVRQALAEAGVTLSDIEGIAVTRGPGLVGSLLVGLSTAKALSFATGIPFVGVNHIEGHIAAVFLSEERPEFPFIALVVSGGHTNIYRADDFAHFVTLGQTRDDAAGEAFDKGAKMLDLDYPGGVVIDRIAREGNPAALSFPKALRGSLDFSFSGLKTSLLYYLKKRQSPVTEEEMPDIAASYQEAIVDVLVEKTLNAAVEQGLSRVVVSGGVAANSRLRRSFLEAGAERGIRIFVPPPILCTDNAAMIAVVGEHLLKAGKSDCYDLNAVSRWPVDLPAGI